MAFGAKLTVLILTLFLSGAIFSINCPNLSDIQAEGISHAARINNQIYAGYEFSQYNTSSEWAFIIGYFENVTESQAITNGNLILSTMTAPGVLDPNTSVVVCRYDTNYNNVFALTVKDISQISPMKIKQYLQNAH